MVWVRLDDQFTDHRKLAELGDYAPLAGWLYIAGLCYCNRQLTDGRIPKAHIPRLCPFTHISIETGGISDIASFSDEAEPHEIAEMLVMAGLWEDEDRWYYKVHDYEQYQPSKEQVEKERNQGKERAERFRERRVLPLKKVSNALSNGVTNGSVTGALNPTRTRTRTRSPGNLITPAINSNMYVCEENEAADAATHTPDAEPQIDYPSTSVDEYQDSGPAAAKPVETSHLVAALFGEYQKAIQPNATLTDAARRKITTRLRSFTPEQIQGAIEHFSADSWEMENNAHRGAAWWFATDDRTEAYMNLKPRQSTRASPNGKPALSAAAQRFVGIERTFDAEGEIAGQEAGP